jgi:hypothetical protein
LKPYPRGKPFPQRMGKPGVHYREAGGGCRREKLMCLLSFLTLPALRKVDRDAV